MAVPFAALLGCGWALRVAVLHPVRRLSGVSCRPACSENSCADAVVRPANLVLQDTVERYFAADMYADVRRGVFLVRGENVLLLGEIDLDRDDEPPPGLREAEPGVVHAAWKKEQAFRKRRDKTKTRGLAGEGFEPEHSGETLF